MVIKFIKGTAGIGLGYASGSETDNFSDTQAQELIESGFAVEVKEKQSVVNPSQLDNEVIETADVKQSEEIETADAPKKKAKK